VFVVSAVEALPCELAGVADRVTINFPWGSLLRGLMHGDDSVLRNIAMVCAPGAEIAALWSITGRDRGVVGPCDEGVVRSRFAGAGMDVAEVRPATGHEVETSHSSWAKRLRVGHDRPATLLRAFRR